MRTIIVSKKLFVNRKNLRFLLKKRYLHLNLRTKINLGMIFEKDNF